MPAFRGMSVAMSSSGSPRRYRHFAPLAVGADYFKNLIEEARRQEVVVKLVAARDFAQIIARPQELVRFIDHHPRALEIKPELLLDPLWHLNGQALIVRGAMRDR